MATGKIRTLRVDKGFGFIKDTAGQDYFFHKSAVYGEGLEDLREGDSVEFEIGEGPKGPRADNVRRTEQHATRSPGDRARKPVKPLAHQVVG